MTPLRSFAHRSKWQPSELRAPDRRLTNPKFRTKLLSRHGHLIASPIGHLYCKLKAYLSSYRSCRRTRRRSRRYDISELPAPDNQPEEDTVIVVASCCARCEHYRRSCTVRRREISITTYVRRPRLLFRFPSLALGAFMVPNFLPPPLKHGRLSPRCSPKALRHRHSILVMSSIVA